MKMVSMIVRFVEEERKRRQTQTSVVIGLYSGMIVNFVLFTLFWLAAFTSQDLVAFLSSGEFSIPTSVGKVLALMFFMLMGMATSWGYSELAVSLVSALFGIYSAGLVQKVSHGFAKLIAGALVAFLVLIGAPNMMLIGVISIRVMSGSKAPMNEGALGIGLLVVIAITIIGPGLLSNPMTIEQARSLTFTNLLGFANESAARQMENNPEIAFRFLREQLPPPDWKVADQPQQTWGLVSRQDYNDSVLPLYDQGYRLSYPPGQWPPKEAAWFKPGAIQADQPPSTST